MVKILIQLLRQLYLLMEHKEIAEKAQRSAERAALNDIKQSILFRWHHADRPKFCEVPCFPQQKDLTCRAVAELNDRYPNHCFYLKII